MSCRNKSNMANFLSPNANSQNETLHPAKADMPSAPKDPHEWLNEMAQFDATDYPIGEHYGHVESANHRFASDARDSSRAGGVQGRASQRYAAVGRTPAVACPDAERVITLGVDDLNPPRTVAALRTLLHQIHPLATYAALGKLPPDELAELLQCAAETAPDLLIRASNMTEIKIINIDRGLPSWWWLNQLL
jgi:hypothetical protein